MMAIVLFCAACNSDPVPEWHDEVGYRWRELSPAGSGPTGFTSLSANQTGVEFTNVFSEESLLDNDILANGSGVALGDFDDDGLVDLYLTSVEGSNVLYRNLGDWQFKDVTEGGGVGLRGSISRGAAWADMDGDGDLDLLVTRHSDPNVLFRNDGDGRFTDISDQSGFEAPLASHSLAIADTDKDGDLDLYITNYKDRWVRDTFAPADREFDQVVGKDGNRFFIRPEFEEYFRLEFKDEDPRRWEFGQPDEFYRNDGDHLSRVLFTDSMFRDEMGNTLARDPDEWGLAARFTDLDLDGDVDLYVCNDINSPDHIWINDGSGQFRWIDRIAIRKTSTASMAVAVADVDRDGWPDLFVAEMLSPDPIERKAQVPEAELAPAEPGEVNIRPQVKRNTLQMNRGDGTFSEIALQAGLAASGWTWGALFLDVDLDGFEDLLTSNGTVLDWLDGDAQERTQRVTAGDDWRRTRLQFPPRPLKNIVFRNSGDGTFQNTNEAWGFGVEEDISHGIAAGDLDGDGDADIVINRLNSPVLVLRNESPATRVAIRLKSTGQNSRAIGARVRFEAPGLPVQSDEVIAGGLYLSDSDDALVFAAASDSMGVLNIDWPDGSASAIHEVQGGRLYEVFSTADRNVSSKENVIPDPLFEDVSQMLGHTHHETFFNEFTRQPLLPLRLAQMGPGVSWIDEDRDGYPELWVGTGAGGRVTRFDNIKGRLQGVMVGSESAGDITTILPAPPRSPGLVIEGVMNYESNDPQIGIAQPSVLALGTREESELIPGAPSTTGPLALADYDGDGDLDLFVGGRTIPTAYPIPTQSRFFKNEGGSWSLDSVNTQALGGMLVSAAVFSDVDQDGDADLLLATDWGPIRVIRNDDGLFHDVTREWGLADLIGRWNGIATGDLNEDGQPDIVVTAWGTNTEAQLASAGTEILHGDVDQNGMYDVIELEIRSDGSRAPVRRLAQMARGLPFIRRSAPNHRSYAVAELESLFPGVATSTERNAVTELRHMVLMSGNDGYEVRPLPEIAQRAPSFGVNVSDLDGDGHQDVVLSHNFFATKLETPRYDAGRGLLLSGDGTGKLNPIEASRSGILAYGDGRGLAIGDFNADGRLDIVLGQNGSQTLLLRNVRAKPGLRVRLIGEADNPDAVGATVRLEYEHGLGPAHEVQSGSGYWSHDQLTPTLGFSDIPLAVIVRWPNGSETRTQVVAVDREVIVRYHSANP